MVISCKVSLYEVMFSNNTYLFRLHIRNACDEKENLSALLFLNFHIILFANYKTLLKNIFNFSIMASNISLLKTKANPKISQDGSNW